MPATAPFDGSNDAPPSTSSLLCSECGEIESHANHAEENEEAHFFHIGERLAEFIPEFDRKSVGRPLDDLYGTEEERERRRAAKESKVYANRAKTAPRLPIARPPKPEAEPECTRCGLTKFAPGSRHRGRGAHTFTTEPLRATVVQTDNTAVLAAIEKAVREAVIGRDARIQIGPMRVEGIYSKYDGNVKGATVQLKVFVFYDRN